MPSTFKVGQQLEFVGTGTVWDDLRVPLSSIKRLGFTDPDWVKLKDNGAGSTGVYVLGFDGGGSDEEVFFAVQIPHGWKIGSDICPHVHWCPGTANTGNVRWGLKYTVADINGTIGNTTITYQAAAAPGVAYQHTLSAFADIDMSGISGLSPMVVCRLFRESSDAADTLNGEDALLLEVDFHYEINTVGSAQEGVK